MSTRVRTQCAVCLLIVASAAGANAQGSPAKPPIEAPHTPRIARDSLSPASALASPPAGMQWRLPPLVDGARSVVVPVRPMPPYRAPDAPRRVPATRDSIVYAMRIIVPDTARLAPMPVMRPIAKP